jgi:Mor family transcriptional regulator
MAAKSDFFAALHGVILDAAEDFGFGPPTADRLAGQIERLMRQRLGGDVYYIPTPSKTERDRQMRELYRRGTSLQRLAVHFRLSENRVRQIVSGKPE